MTPRDLALAARDAGRVLQALPSPRRTAVLHRVADALDANRARILFSAGSLCGAVLSLGVCFGSFRHPCQGVPLGQAGHAASTL